MLKFSHCIRCL